MGLSFEQEEPCFTWKDEDTHFRLKVIEIQTREMEHSTHLKCHQLLYWAMLTRKMHNLFFLKYLSYRIMFRKPPTLVSWKNVQRLWDRWSLGGSEVLLGPASSKGTLGNNRWSYTGVMMEKNGGKTTKIFKSPVPMFLDLAMLNLLRVTTHWLGCLRASQSQIREQ